MLTEYKGPANSSEIFAYLIGETIKASFINDEGHIVCVLSSGSAIVFGCGPNRSSGKPAFWSISNDEVRKFIESRKQEIVQKVAELGELS